MVGAVVGAVLTPDTWNRFVDDAGPLAEGAAVSLRRASPSRGDRVVRDEELPRLGGYRGDVRLVVTGGAGQVAGPAAYCRQQGVEVSALDVAVRDLDDPAGNVRRLVTAVDAALAAGDPHVHDRVLQQVAGEPSPAWLAALDLIAASEWLVALPLAQVDPGPWIDAAMDRETPVSLIGGTVEQAVAALTTAAGLWGDEGDLRAARRWVHSWVTAEADAALEYLEGLT